MSRAASRATSDAMSDAMSGDERLALSRHADLKTRASGDVLVLPERAIRLAGSGGEILRLCLPERSRSEVLRTMRERYPEDAGVEDHVRAFLDEMIALGGLVVRAGAGDRGPS